MTYRDSCRRNVLPARRGWILPAALVALAVWGLAAARADEDFPAYRRRSLFSLQGRFSRIAASHEREPAMKAFRERLAVVDEVAGLLVRRFQCIMSSSLDDLLEGADPLSVAGGPGKMPRLTASACEILDRYSQRFARGLAKPSVTEQEMKVLRDYYDAAARSAGRFIAERGRVVQAINKRDAIEVLELCLVEPFLHVRDGSWSAGEVRSLPEWMRSPQNLKALEGFSLRVRRPFTAWQFALFGGRTTGGGGADYPAYLSAAASRLVQSREYRAGIHCLRTGIDLAESRGMDEVVMAMRCQLAELLDEFGHTRLAAEQAKRVLAGRANPSSYGKAAVLRLKYLYKAGRFAEILKEAPTYQEDQRCRAYLPQILYVSWVVHRREGRLEAAGKLKELFFARFPRHPVGSEIYFASAVTAIASGNRQEAQRLLEIIRYRYGDSRVIAKVEQIRKRLEKTPKGLSPGSRRDR